MMQQQRLGNLNLRPFAAAAVTASPAIRIKMSAFQPRVNWKAPRRSSDLDNPAAAKPSAKLHFLPPVPPEMLAGAGAYPALPERGFHRSPRWFLRVQGAR